jgi:SAM-dependent methyltransferase
MTTHERLPRDDSVLGNGLVSRPGHLAGGSLDGPLLKRDFWEVENLRYRVPHYRLVRAARIARGIAGGRRCTLLDVGCGPATLKRFLPESIRYYGIDLAIHDPAPYLREVDVVEEPIAFDDRRFDLVVAQGLFEYLGGVQEEKFEEIARLLKPNGTFLTSYVNFGHRNPNICSSYSNVQPLAAFRASIGRSFQVDRVFPVCHNWNPTQPTRPLVRAANMLVPWNIPVLSRLLAVEYFFVCSRKPR